MNCFDYSPVEPNAFWLLYVEKKDGFWTVLKVSLVWTTRLESLCFFTSMECMKVTVMFKTYTKEKNAFTLFSEEKLGSQRTMPPFPWGWVLALVTFLYLFSEGDFSLWVKESISLIWKSRTYLNGMFTA